MAEAGRIHAIVENAKLTDAEYRRLKGGHNFFVSGFFDSAGSFAIRSVLPDSQDSLRPVSYLAASEYMQLADIDNSIRSGSTQAKTGADKEGLDNNNDIAEGRR